MEQKELNINKTIYELVSMYPELVNILAELGFNEITKDAMLKTVGRVMKLKMGCSLRKIDFEFVKTKLNEYGFIIKED